MHCADTKNAPLCGAAVGEQLKAKAYPAVKAIVDRIKPALAK